MNNKLCGGIKSICYGYEPLHSILFSAFGSNGENLTIMILSCNRSVATLKLLNSIISVIPNYKGDILVIDNNSAVSELNKIKEFIRNQQKSFNINLVKFDRNYGCAKGRNMGIDFVKTDWVMSLDNDIYFISNPLMVIKNSIVTCGAYFANIPLLSEDGTKFFENGGHIYVDYDSGINIGGGSLFEQKAYNENAPFETSLSTFMFGGACVFNKNKFLELGKFDDNYFIGFEDTDFSIRLFKAGYKIVNCPVASLIHNHVFSNNVHDYDYEKQRFSSEIIKNSAMYFEKKWALNVWNANLNMWLKARRDSLGIIDTNVDTKKKLALVVDSKGWAFWNIAMEIKKRLLLKYDIEIIVVDYFDDIYPVVMYLSKFDHIHFFWRGHLSWIKPLKDDVFVSRYGVSYDYFNENYVEKLKHKTTTSVYDHLFIKNKDEIDFTNNIFSFVLGYTVSSKKLFNIYNEKKLLLKPSCVITDGVSSEMFYPQNIERFANCGDRTLIVGWVGNSSWSSELGDIKGVNTLLKPALAELKKENYLIDSYFADRQERMIPHDKMCDYYSKIDLLVCVSEIEGTPNPVLEAMACGVPVVSTDVGIVPEVFGNIQKKYILKDRNIKCLKEKIVELINDPDILKKMSDENIRMIKKWEWNLKVKEFENFFDNYMKESELQDEGIKKKSSK